MAIVGRPNVGKSSLLNAWSRCDRAIVMELPGTTRDVVESQLVVGGIPIQVLDTAGIRDTMDQVEQLGVVRSQTAAQNADLVLLTINATAGWTAADQAIYDQVQQRPLILIVNKIDQLDPKINLTIDPAINPKIHTTAALNYPDTVQRIIKSSPCDRAGSKTSSRLDLSPEWCPVAQIGIYLSSIYR